MATTAVRDITIRVGDYYSHKIILPAADADGNAIDWDTATFSSMIRDTAGSSTVIETFSVDSTNAQDTPPYIVLSLTAAETAALTPGTYVWDFQETRNSQPHTPIGGKARVVQDVSRA